MEEQERWQVRAAAWELIALSFRYPDDTLAKAVCSGEWVAAAREIAEALGCRSDFECDASRYFGDAVATEAAAIDFLHRLRAEATRLFVGAPAPVVSPYEGVWRAADDGVQALLFVSPHTMEVERFMRECGFVRPETENEPLDHIATEAELMEHLALRAAGIEAASEGYGVGFPDQHVVDDPNADRLDQQVADDPNDDQLDRPAAGDPSIHCPGQLIAADFPSKSAAAYNHFLATHLLSWAPRFAAAVVEESTSPFYRTAATFLVTILNEAKGATDIAADFMGEYRNVFEELAK